MDSSIISRSNSINDVQKVAIDINETEKNDQTKKFISGENHEVNQDIHAINDVSKMSRIETSPTFWEKLSPITKISCASSTFCCTFIVCLLVYSAFIKG
jgi:hypothetical protein